MMTRCNGCNTELVDGGVDWYCPNKECSYERDAAKAWLAEYKEQKEYEKAKEIILAHKDYENLSNLKFYCAYRMMELIEDKESVVTKTVIFKKEDVEDDGFITVYPPLDKN